MRRNVATYQSAVLRLGSDCDEEAQGSTRDRAERTDVERRRMRVWVASGRPQSRRCRKRGTCAVGEVIGQLEPWDGQSPITDFGSRGLERWRFRQNSNQINGNMDQRSEFSPPGAGKSPQGVAPHVR